ncbi:MAG: hypothetical protein OXH49_04010 [Gemmatimonadetes bacterium]|nr:hypothetical protein [Gemmatimonadota bacterium]
MIEMVKRGIRCALIATLGVGGLCGVASAQARQDSTEDIRNVLLTFQLIQADGFTEQNPEISDVVSQLRKLFSFEGYRLLATSVFNVGMMTNDSGTRLSGEGSQQIIAGDSETPFTIRADVRSPRGTGAVRARVTLTDIITRQLNPRTGSTERAPLLEASVTIRDGQTVVLGSARRTAGEPVLILVVTPQVDPE